MATLNRHSARRNSRTSTTTADVESSALETTARPLRSGRRRAPAAPPRRVALALSLATVSMLAVFDLLSAEPAATADSQDQLASASVAEALGIEATEVEAPALEERELLGQLATSRSQRDAEQAAAGATQAQAEQAAAAAQAEAEARAAAEAAAAAAAEAAAANPVAAAAAAGTAVTAVARISNSAGPVRPQTQAAADAFVSNVPGADGITIGGTRASAADPGGHPSGLALDIMVLSDVALGDAIVAYHVANWDALGVEYLIYRQRMLSSPGGSWKPMEDRGSPTQNHMDHVHVNYVG